MLCVNAAALLPSAPAKQLSARHHQGAPLQTRARAFSRARASRLACSGAMELKVAGEYGYVVAVACTSWAVREHPRRPARNTRDGNALPLSRRSTPPSLPPSIPPCTRPHSNLRQSSTGSPPPNNPDAEHWWAGTGGGAGVYVDGRQRTGFVWLGFGTLNHSLALLSTLRLSRSSPRSAHSPPGHG
jgi:hypothetical protein